MTEPDHAVSVPRRIAFWLIVAMILGLVLWLLSGMLLPFVLGAALAYVCDPLADRLERLRFPRWLATLTVLLTFVAVGVAALLLVAPLIQSQILQLIDRVPHFADMMRGKIMPELSRIIERVSGGNDGGEVQRAANSYAADISRWAINLLGGVWSGGVAIINIAYVLLLTPLVAYYLLRDWDLIIARIDGWLPRRQAGVVRELAVEIDRILAGFVRGQATVCLLFAVYYSAALTAAGLNYGLVIGIAAGILTFIPYLGAIAGLVASLAVAFSQFDDYSRVAIVAGVYIVGHIIEGNVVTPNLVGDRVGLHPVWVIFALLAGGTLFGFTGVLLAVPVAAVIGVVVRFSIRQYLASSYYDDFDRDEAEFVERANSAELGQL